jgi:hypothetical protein
MLKILMIFNSYVLFSYLLRGGAVAVVAAVKRAVSW